MAADAVTRFDTPEHRRLEDARTGRVPWKAWGPYLSERQWGTVREDYSDGGDAWRYFPHDQARSRAYRWGEDGIAGVCDDRQRLCLSLALWNGADPILKERMFGLTNGEGNHGEDVKEYWFYLDSTPTHSYLKCLYKYPQRGVPLRGPRRDQRPAAAGRVRVRAARHRRLRRGPLLRRRRRVRQGARPTTSSCCVTAHNRGPDAATLHLLPTLWFRNTWSWGDDVASARRLDGRRRGAVARDATPSSASGRCTPTRPPSCCSARTRPTTSGCSARPTRRRTSRTRSTTTSSRARRRGQPGRARAPRPPPTTCCEIAGRGRARPSASACRGRRRRAATAARRRLRRGVRRPPRRGRRVLRDGDPGRARRRRGAGDAPGAGRAAVGQAVLRVRRPPLAARARRQPVGRGRAGGRCATSPWFHMVAGDVISMPDKWEYPWFAAWDLAFHCGAARARRRRLRQGAGRAAAARRATCTPTARSRPTSGTSATSTRRCTAWAALCVYEREAEIRGEGDREFLARVFQRLLTNFTWWVNRKDPDDRNLFQGGFLGLDNIGIFDRSAPLPGGGTLEQADGTAWMALYCQWMLQIAVELARARPVLRRHGAEVRLALRVDRDRAGPARRQRRAVGRGGRLLLRRHAHARRHARSRSRCARSSACCRCARRRSSTPRSLDAQPGAHGARRRVRGALRGRRPGARPPCRAPSPEGRAAARRSSTRAGCGGSSRRCSTRTSSSARTASARSRGATSTSPACSTGAARSYDVRYLPAESDTGMFGGNSNWRGPVWFPMNLVILRGAAPAAPLLRRRASRSSARPARGNEMTLLEVAAEIGGRPDARPSPRDEHGRRPVFGGIETFQADPHWRDLLLFHEYFHGDNGAGLGASHQTGWTGTVALLFPMADGVPRAGRRSAGARRLSAPMRLPPARRSTRSTPPSGSSASARGGRPLDLGEVPAAAWDALAALPVDAVWLMGVWQRSPAGPRDRAGRPGLDAGIRAALPDLRDRRRDRLAVLRARLRRRRALRRAATALAAARAAARRARARR